MAISIMLLTWYIVSQMPDSMQRIPSMKVFCPQGMLATMLGMRSGRILAGWCSYICRSSPDFAIDYQLYPIHDPIRLGDIYGEGVICWLLLGYNSRND